MESVNIYETSLEEVLKIRKNLTTDNVSINFNRLDNQTAGQLKSAMQDVLSKRYTEINTIVMGVR